MFIGDGWYNAILYYNHKFFLSLDMTINNIVNKFCLLIKKEEIGTAERHNRNWKTSKSIRNLTS